MKRTNRKLSWCLIMLFNLCFLVQFSDGQENSKTGMNLRAETVKSEYLLLEPVYLKIQATLPVSYNSSEIKKHLILIVTSAEKSQRFEQLSYNLTQGEPEQLPAISKSGELILLGQTIKTEGKEIARPVEEYNNSEEHIFIQRVAEIFPKPGNYMIQVVLRDFQGNDGLLSNTINISIKEPTDLNKKALNFLSVYEQPLSFSWVWKEKNGVELLERFVNEYENTVYAGYSIYRLALIYYYRGDINKARNEFEKIKSNENKVIADEANKFLGEIKSGKAALQEQKQN